VAPPGASHDRNTASLNSNRAARSLARRRGPGEVRLPEGLVRGVRCRWRLSSVAGPTSQHGQQAAGSSTRVRICSLLPTSRRHS